MSGFTILLAILAGAATQGPSGLATSLHLSRPNTLGPRRLSPNAAVCVNPPLNLTRLEIDTGKAAEELAGKIRDAGFHAAPLGVFESCDATLFTEIVGEGRKNVRLEFRILMAGEQIPRMCSSTPSRKAATWREALAFVFAGEARQIREAQVKGMAIYQGAVE
jgi:hypothetical protein